MALKDAEDEKIKRITEMLERGGTMLATHHECGAPMFRYQGKVICPVCSSQEHDQIIESRKVTKEGEEAKSIKDSSEIKSPSDGATEVERIIMKKVTEIANSLENENDHRRVFEGLESIEKGLTILKLLRK